MFTSVLAHINSRHVIFTPAKMVFALFLYLFCMTSYATTDMRVKQFEWLPSVVKVGEPTTFYWNIENAVSCFGNNKPRTPSGNNGIHIYDAPRDHTTSWYCTDRNGEKIYLTAKSIVQEDIPVPARPSRSVGTLDGNNITFTWNASPGASYYLSKRSINGSSYSFSPITKHYGTSTTLTNQEPGTYRFKTRACNANDECSYYSGRSNLVTVEAPPAMVVKQFEWIPAVAQIGEQTTFHWNVENAKSCFGNNKSRTPSGNNGIHVYTEPKEHITQWYCNDALGNRLPADETKYLEAPLTVKAPAMVVKQFEWLPNKVVVGQETSFHWNVENAESCFGNNKTRTASGNNGIRSFSEPQTHVTQWYCNDKFGNRLPADETKFIESTIQVSAAPKMVVKQFEWIPAVAEVGQATTFHWNVENAESCFGNNKTRAATGNNGVHIYDEPLNHVTQWYCNDKYGNRLPTNETKFIEAPLTVKAPAMVVKQFEWLPNKVVVGQETSFHWNVENAESCFGNNKTRTASGNNGIHRFTEPKTHTTQWFCNDKYGNRLPADETKFIEAPLQVDAAPEMVVKQFEWLPSVVVVGEPTSFHWQVENAESCFGNNKVRTPSGNNGAHIYNAPLNHVTQWYCNDKYGNRFPADETKFLEAPLTVVAPPAMVVKQFEWIPAIAKVGESTTFHWNVENAKSCFGNGKTRTPSGNNGVHIYDAPMDHMTQWYCHDEYGNRLPKDESKFIEAPLQVVAPEMVVKQFEWIPAVAEVGQSTTFHWNVENAESCFGNNKSRTPSGNNGVHIYDAPMVHMTQWYCNDKYGNRLPADETKFIETPLTIKAPAMVVKQFEWIPAVAKVGEATTFHWNVENAESCFGNEKPRTPSGNNGIHRYDAPMEHVTQWYCNDKFGFISW